MKLHLKVAAAMYFAIQAIRKEPVSAQLKDVYAELYSFKVDIQKQIVKRARDLLKFALEHVEFYKQMPNRGALLKDLSRIDDYDEMCGTIAKIPAIDKQMFIKLKKQFQSDQYSMIRGYTTYSSGSTGEPLSFDRDQVDWARSHANLISILSIFGVSYGEPHIYYWAGDWSDSARIKNKVRDVVFNRKRFSVYQQSRKDLECQLQEILAYAPKYVYGLPSGITRLGKLALSTGVNLQKLGIVCVFTTGETLTENAKDTIRQAFGAPICDLYGCAEVGIIAFDCPNGNKHALVNTNFVEMAEDGNVLITNLFQRKYVLIRYAVGDIVEEKMLWEKCACGLHYPTIGRIIGRKSEDIQLPNGKRVPTMATSYIFDRVIFNTDVLAGQYVLSMDGTLRLHLVPGTTFSTDTIRLLEKESRALFGMDVVAVIVDGISPVRGGKKIDFIQESECM